MKMITNEIKAMAKKIEELEKELFELKSEKRNIDYFFDHKTDNKSLRKEEDFNLGDDIYIRTYFIWKSGGSMCSASAGLGCSSIHILLKDLQEKIQDRIKQIEFELKTYNEPKNKDNFLSFFKRK